MYWDMRDQRIVDLDTMEAVNRTFTYSAASDDILWQDDATADDDINVLSTSGSAPSVAFMNPSATLLIDTGGGNSITLSGVTLGDLDSFDFIF